MVSAPDAIGAGIARGAAAAPAGKPVITVYISSLGAPASIHSGARGALPCYAFPENAAIALAAAARHSRWCRRERGEVLAFDRFAVAGIRAVVDRVLAATAEPHWLSSDDVATLLQAAGIELAVSERVAPGEPAAGAAERLGYPLVAKLLSPDILHKSDVGGVVLGLRSAE